MRRSRQSRQARVVARGARTPGRSPPLRAALPGTGQPGGQQRQRAHAHSAAPRPRPGGAAHVLLAGGATGSPPAPGARAAPPRPPALRDRGVGGPGTARAPGLPAPPAPLTPPIQSPRLSVSRPRPIPGACPPLAPVGGKETLPSVTRRVRKARASFPFLPRLPEPRGRCRRG